MNHKLQKLLDKRGVEITELSSQEKEQFDRWHKVLSEGEISVDKIKQFCDIQIKSIQEQWKNLDNDSKKNERLILLHTVYSTLLNLINAPQVEREALELYLNQLLDS